MNSSQREALPQSSQRTAETHLNGQKKTKKIQG